MHPTIYFIFHHVIILLAVKKDQHMDNLLTHNQLSSYLLRIFEGCTFLLAKNAFLLLIIIINFLSLAKEHFIVLS